MQIRDEIKQLMALGALPDESSYDIPDGMVEKYEHLLNQITPPLSASEAFKLITLLPKKACFGLETHIIRLLESTDGWPLTDAIRQCPSNKLKETIKKRVVLLG